MIRSRKFASWLLVAATCCATAQTPPLPMPAEGAPVALVFTTALNSRTAAVGDPVAFELAEDLKADGVVLAKAGSPASGRVVQVKRAALAGRSGSIGLRLNDLAVGHVQIELRGDREGAGSEVQLSRPHHLKWPMGLLRNGDELEIKVGAPLTVFAGKVGPMSASE